MLQIGDEGVQRESAETTLLAISLGYSVASPRYSTRDLLSLLLPCIVCWLSVNVTYRRLGVGNRANSNLVCTVEENISLLHATVV